MATLTNQEMKAGRFARWAVARRKAAWIAARLAEGRTVYIATYLRVTKMTAKHADMIKATKSGLYLQRGRAWDCIDFCKISAR